MIHPISSWTHSVTICYGEQLVWTPSLTAGNITFVNTSSLLKIVYLNKPFLSETPLKATRWPIPLAELGTSLVGVVGRRQGCGQIPYWHICLGKGCLIPSSHVHKWLDKPEVTRQPRKFMPHSHLFRQDLVSTDQSSEDRLSLKVALRCSDPSEYFHGIATPPLNIQRLASIWMMPYLSCKSLEGQLQQSAWAWA